jgi:hypothetical protein
MGRFAIITDGRVSNLIVADSADALPGVTLIEAEGDTAIGDIYQDGVFSKPAPDRRAEIAAEIGAIKAFLAATDWILIKIAEYNLLGEDTEALKTEYSEILTKRHSERSRMNELESELVEINQGGE